MGHYSHGFAQTKQQTSWLVHNWNTFGAWTNYENTQIHKTHHDSNLGEATTFPFTVFSMIGHKACTQMSFFSRLSSWESRNSRHWLLPLWRPITSCVDLQLRQDLKQNCSPRWEIFNNMCHVTCTHMIKGDRKLLVVRNQIDILILDLYFNHNLCCKYSNGSCQPILDIYVLRNFQWYKEVFNPMNFDFFDHSLNI